MANSVDPDQTAPIGAVCSGSTLFASILNSSEMLGNYLQQTIFSDAFFSWPFRVNPRPYPTDIFCLKMVSTFYVCCIYPNALRLDSFMEANTMNSGQTAPLGCRIREK